MEDFDSSYIKDKALGQKQNLEWEQKSFPLDKSVQKVAGKFFVNGVDR